MDPRSKDCGDDGRGGGSVARTRQRNLGIFVLVLMVARDRIELPTRGFSVPSNLSDVCEFNNLLFTINYLGSTMPDRASLYMSIFVIFFDILFAYVHRINLYSNHVDIF